MWGKIIIPMYRLWYLDLSLDLSLDLDLDLSLDLSRLWVVYVREDNYSNV